jgi:outer membrane protein assembly factor BamB
MYKTKLLVVLFTAIVFGAVPAFAGEPIIWDIGSRTDLLKGEAHGISISDTGVVTLAPRANELFNTEQAYVWSTAIDAAGNVYLGTGHDGKLFRVGADGKGSLLFKASELDVTALAIAKDGAVFAATSPDGKVYRVTADGKSEVYFDPKDKYIWSLAILNDGSLAVGTGDNGKLYRVRTAGAKPETSLLIDTNQTHVMSLAVTARGDLIAGTDPGGVVLRISSDGKAFALYDASLREIHSLATAPDGSIYALALGDAAATAKSPARPRLRRRRSRLQLTRRPQPRLLWPRRRCEAETIFRIHVARSFISSPMAARTFSGVRLRLLDFRYWQPGAAC